MILSHDIYVCFGCVCHVSQNRSITFAKNSLKVQNRCFCGNLVYGRKKLSEKFAEFSCRLFVLLFRKNALLVWLFS